jgi:hypothetical protein
VAVHVDDQGFRLAHVGFLSDECLEVGGFSPASVLLSRAQRGDPDVDGLPGTGLPRFARNDNKEC